jgi:hypothetical protein
LTGGVWEPACGDGAIVDVCREWGIVTLASDLNDHGCGMTGCDFLKQPRLLAPNIVTNPPFKLANQFVEKGLDLGAEKVCLFLRLAFLEGARRYNSGLWKRLHRVHVFAERQTLWRGNHARAGEEKGGMIAFAWFVWERSEHEQSTVLTHIPPLKSAL